MSDEAAGVDVPQAVVADLHTDTSGHMVVFSLTEAAVDSVVT